MEALAGVGGGSVGAIGIYKSSWSQVVGSAASWLARSFTSVQSHQSLVPTDLCLQEPVVTKSRSIPLAGNVGSCFVHSETGDGQG